MNTLFYIYLVLNFVYVIMLIDLVYKYGYLKIKRNIFLYDFTNDKIKTLVDYISDNSSWIKWIPSIYINFLDKYYIDFYGLTLKEFIRFQIECIFIFAQLCLIFALFFKVNTIVFFILVSISFIALLDYHIIKQYNTRSGSFSSNLIEFIDTISLCLSSGMDIISSFREASCQKKSVLHKEFLNFIRRIELGMSIEESFSIVNTKSSEELSYFITTISYAIETGSDLSETINKISDDIKQNRFLGLETKAGEISVKMLFPMLLCIFPSVVTLLISPMIIDWFVNS